MTRPTARTRASAWLPLGAVLALAGLGAAAAAQPEGDGRAMPSIRVETSPVPLDAADASVTRIAGFVYAGGISLRSPSDRFHGLSDIEITGGDRLLAVGDLGVTITGRLQFDARRRLTGVSEVTLAPLADESGAAMADKSDADAEGLALLPNGDRLVSFERRHRVWRYPAGGGRPRPAPSPLTAFPDNSGMEAIAADPETAPDAYLVSGEMSGDLWSCRLSQPLCVSVGRVVKSDDFGLVSMKRLAGNHTVYLLRSFDERRGNQASLQLFRGSELLARLDLARPRTVDNFEGVAVTPGPDGSLRFYLLSDDNARASQRTLLMAFDWMPR